MFFAIFVIYDNYNFDISLLFCSNVFDENREINGENLISFQLLMQQYYITDHLEPLVQFVYADRSYCSFIRA